MTSHAILSEKKEQLEQELRSNPVISDVFESVQLVSKGVVNLFLSNQISKVFQKTFETQDAVQKLKKKIIQTTVHLNGQILVDLLDSIPPKILKKIGIEFLLTTLRKMAKQHAIEKYAQVLQIIFKSFGFDSKFLKSFFIIERDYSEILFLLNYIKKWKDEDQISHDYILQQSTVYFLEKIAQTDRDPQMENFLNLFKESYEFLSQEFIQDTLQNLLIHALGQILSKNNAFTLTQQTIQLFNQKNFEWNQLVFNKVLKALSRNCKDTKILDYIMEIPKNQKIEMDLQSYNMVMDFYASNNDTQQARKTFTLIKEKGFNYDSFSYSIMIKALKNSQDENLENAMSLMEEYKQTQTQEIIFYNSILDLFIQKNQNQMIDQIYEEILRLKIQPDEITFNTIIKGSCNNKNISLAMKYFNLMQQNGLKPNRITFNTLMDCSVKTEKMNEALQIFESMSQNDIEPDNITYSIVLNGLKLNNSSLKLVKICLSKINKVIDENIIQFDLVTFNALLEICAKHQLTEEMNNYFEIMKKKGMKYNQHTCATLINAFTQINDYNSAILILNKMIDTGMVIRESLYGVILECCMKNGKSDLVLDLFNKLKDEYYNKNSIVFTTIVKGFLNQGKYDDALLFFEKIKHLKELPGMIITFNCALDIYSNKKDNLQKAIQLFDEIDNYFKADLISFSTIIKSICNAGNKQLALEYVKKMMKSKIEKNVSVVNLFLENCCNREDFKLGIDCYYFVMAHGIEPNEIFFGIMIKIFGIAHQLDKGFDLIDLMEVYKINPSIIIFTNLVHISFYCRQPKKAEQAYNLFRKTNKEGDAILYSKIIDGLIRFKQFNRVPKYIQYCIKDKSTLKPQTIDNVLNAFQGQEMQEKIDIIRSFRKKNNKNNNKMTNHFNIDNPKQFKKEIAQQRIRKLNSNVEKKDYREEHYKQKNQNYGKSGETKMFNFRQKKNA